MDCDSPKKLKADRQPHLPNEPGDTGSETTSYLFLNIQTAGPGSSWSLVEAEVHVSSQLSDDDECLIIHHIL